MRSPPEQPPPAKSAALLLQSRISRSHAPPLPGLRHSRDPCPYASAYAPRPLVENHSRSYSTRPFPESQAEVAEAQTTRLFREAEEGVPEKMSAHKAKKANIDWQQVR